MQNLNNEILYYSLELNNYLKEKNLDHLPEGYIEEYISSNKIFRISDEDYETIKRKLETSFTIRQTFGSVIRSDYKPWLRERKQKNTQAESWFYSLRLSNYLAGENILPPGVISTLDKDTDDILDYCGDPEDKGLWSRRGMVMGHVQFGKTTNYSMLISKAADVGYKFIIILAGLSNSLRTQTQQRIDESFIGEVSDQSMAVVQLPLALKYNLTGVKKRPNYGTFRTLDFGTESKKRLKGVHFENVKGTWVFVMKKYPSILNSIYEYLSKRVGEDIQITEPLLLIDDEADNASVNTLKSVEKQTKINEQIRKILKLFSRSSYIGYTATPFANIFINPDSYTEAVGDDLFPKHFIKALDPPDNYVGSQRVFRPDGDLYNTMVRVIDDYNETLPISHKNFDPVLALPGSLKTAIRIFILTRAIRYLRGQGDDHCSMMINVSRFNDTQTKVEALVIEYFLKLKNSIFINSKSKNPENDKNLLLIKESFNDEFPNCGFSFEDILKILSESITTIQVQIVNMKNKDSLDYDKEKNNGGLHVIAIGGLALSRGLTLEGLTVSYILRNVSASDTLMQMARWFGYRIGYSDICKLYLPQTSLEHYQYVDEAIEELRDEVKLMQLLDKTPEDFGLKVLQSDLAIRITAANKMRAGKALSFAKDFSGKHIEGYIIYNDKNKNQKNWNLVSDFIKKFKNFKNGPQGNCKYINNISGKVILSFIEKFDFPLAIPNLGKNFSGTSLFIDFVKDRIHSDYSLWDVAVTHLKNNKKPQNIFGFDITVRSRNKNTFEEPNLIPISRFYDNKARVSETGDEKILLTQEEINTILKKYDDYELGNKNQKTIPKSMKFHLNLPRPLMLIHPINEGSGKKESKISGLNVSLSFILPSTKIPPKEKTYVANPTFIKQQQDLFAEDELGEDELGEDEQVFFDDSN